MIIGKQFRLQVKLTAVTSTGKNPDLELVREELLTALKKLLHDDVALEKNIVIESRDVDDSEMPKDWVRLG